MYSTNRVTWHNGLIPESEIWVKIGGDKGADTVKLVFQLCNVTSPNSVQNTCVFAVFEGRDTTTNLHVALDRYKDQIEHLTTTEWRYLHVLLQIHTTIWFYIGVEGYDFSCVVTMSSSLWMYGISGAQGRPCLAHRSEYVFVAIRTTSMPLVHNTIR